MANFKVYHKELVADNIKSGSMDDAIDKWEFLSDPDNLADITELWTLGAPTCSLCLKYGIDCVLEGPLLPNKCPVYKLTGKPGCKNTPYQEFLGLLAYRDSCKGETELHEYHVRAANVAEGFMLLLLAAKHIYGDEQYLLVA